MSARPPIRPKRHCQLPVTSESGGVLVVDDDPAICRLLSSLLEEAGFETGAAPNGLEALRVLESHAFDLMLLDLQMPAMSGLQLLRTSGEVVRDTGIVVLTGCDETGTAVEAMRLGALDYIVKPFDAEKVVAALRRASALRAQRAEDSRQRILIGMQTRQLACVEAELARNSERALEALVAALDARERETQHHSKRVSEYAAHLCCVMGIGPAEIEVIRRGGMLHDIGKIGVSDSILLKKGPLSQSEWLEMKNHPFIGHRILQALPSMEAASEIVLMHHENYDGTGYPNRLKGSQIPLGSRIFSVVDSFDAMTSDRPYRRAMSNEAALEEILRCSGGQFDPEIVAAFQRIPLQTWTLIRNRTMKLTARPADSGGLLRRLRA